MNNTVTHRPETPLDVVDAADALVREMQVLRLALEGAFVFDRTDSLNALTRRADGIEDQAKALAQLAGRVCRTARTQDKEGA